MKEKKHLEAVAVVGKNENVRKINQSNEKNISRARVYANISLNVYKNKLAQHARRQSAATSIHMSNLHLASADRAKKKYKNFSSSRAH